jgi:uncharacterized protein (DUF2267 family)
MATTGLETFDTTVHRTNAWLKELMEILGWQDRHAAYRALRATLHALRDRLTVEEAVQLGAQLPMLIRGLYYEGWNPAGKPVRERHREEFLAWISEQLRSGDLVDPEPLAQGVFTLLTRRISAGEIEDVKRVLPAAIRELWP